MPTVTYEGGQIECESGAVLRDVLREAGHSPHNGPDIASCHGLGTCGTCAVAITESLPEPTGRERWRLDFPPHSQESGLRLACQIRVNKDLTVNKHAGFWGHQTR